jgi:hypothetical protein
MTPTTRDNRSSIMWRLQRVAALAIFVICVGASYVGVKAYVLSGQAWGTSQVRYYVNPSNFYVLPADAITAIQSAASAWSTQSSASVQLVYAGTTNGSTVALDYTNNVFFRNDAPGPIAQTYWWADGSGHLLDADIVFHENYAFFTHAVEPCSGGFYVENTITHEFGHALGLYHSPIDTATMYATENACETLKETLDPDDIAGIQAIYPSSTNQAPTAPSQLVVADNTSNPTGALSLNWVNTAKNASGINVYRSADGVNWGTVVSALASSTRSYTDSGLSSGSLYYYMVYAYNNAGSAGSNTASGQTAPVVTTPPAAPSSPNPSNGATGVSTSATLTWTCSGATAYDVYINGALYVANQTSASVPTTLSASTQYSWFVVAKNSAGSTTGPTWSFTTKAVTVVRGKGHK